MRPSVSSRSAGNDARVMADTRPIVFVASSALHEAVVQALATQMEPFAIPDPWVDGQAELGKSVLQWALSKVDGCSYGVFVFAPDGRWGGQINGNVLLELGLFIARHGAERCFILREASVEVPADLRGIITADYSGEQFAQDPAAALVPAVRKIRSALRRRLTLADEILGLWLEDKAEADSEGRYALVEFRSIKGELKLFGRSYDESGTARLEWPKHVNACSIPTDAREIYHTFDSEYDDNEGEHRSLGVTCFRFHENSTSGDGYFVVHGGGGIRKGRISFKLDRVTPEFSRALGLQPIELSFADRRSCARLVRTVAAARAADR
jgi:hypothetical protein